MRFLRSALSALGVLLFLTAQTPMYGMGYLKSLQRELIELRKDFERDIAKAKGMLDIQKAEMKYSLRVDNVEQRSKKSKVKLPKRTFTNETNKTKKITEAKIKKLKKVVNANIDNDIAAIFDRKFNNLIELAKVVEGNLETLRTNTESRIGIYDTEDLLAKKFWPRVYEEIGNLMNGIKNEVEKETGEVLEAFESIGEFNKKMDIAYIDYTKKMIWWGKEIEFAEKLIRGKYGSKETLEKLRELEEVFIANNAKKVINTFYDKIDDKTKKSMAGKAAIEEGKKALKALIEYAKRNLSDSEYKNAIGAKEYIDVKVTPLESQSEFSTAALSIKSDAGTAWNKIEQRTSVLKIIEDQRRKMLMADDSKKYDTAEKTFNEVVNKLKTEIGDTGQAEVWEKIGELSQKIFLMSRNWRFANQDPTLGQPTNVSTFKNFLKTNDFFKKDDLGMTAQINALKTAGGMDKERLNTAKEGMELIYKNIEQEITNHIDYLKNKESGEAEKEKAAEKEAQKEITPLLEELDQQVMGEPEPASTTEEESMTEALIELFEEEEEEEE